jgi:hypothetical protein
VVKFTRRADYRAARFLPLQPQPSPQEFALIRLPSLIEDSRSHPRQPTYAVADSNAIPAAMICQSNFMIN